MNIFQLLCFLSYLFSTSATNNPMTGVHLKIAVFNEPPLFVIRRNPANASQVVYSGISKEIFDFLSNTLNFTYTYIEVSTDVVKMKGTIEDALVDELVQKRADINGRLLTPSSNRLAYIDFSQAVSVQRFGLVQPVPQIRNRFLAAIRPFQFLVWLGVLIVFAMTVIFLTTITIASKPNSTTKRNRKTKLQVASNNAWYALEVLMAQGSYLPTKRLPLRSIAGAWCLTAFVLVYAYNSTLISYISLPTYESVVNNWEEMANSKTLRLVAAKGSLLTNIIMNAESGALRKLGDSIRDHPEDLYLKWDGDAEQILKTGCCALAEVKTVCLFLVYRSMRENADQCKLTVGRDLDFSQLYSFGVVKQFPYLTHLNDKILRTREVGLFSRINPSYSFKSIEKCLVPPVDRPKGSKLNLYDLATAFILLGIGYSASIVIFLLELVTFNFPKTIQDKLSLVALRIAILSTGNNTQ